MLKEKTINKDVQKPRRLNLLHVLVGMVLVGILGLLFDDFIEEHLFSVANCYDWLIRSAIYMIIADKYSVKLATNSGSNQISKRFVIGISQAVAMWPGFSRSGSTITISTGNY